MLDVAQGLNFLHTLNKVHFDIKVCGFGFSLPFSLYSP